MSSSTVSITANPTGTPFRRHTLTGDKNPSSNSTNSDETDTSPVTEEEPIRETNTSHPIKPLTETVHTQIPLSPNYTTKWSKSGKRTVGKHRRIGLKTVVRVIVKNLIVVMMLVVFVHLIRGLSVNQRVGFDTVFNPRFEYERRILEIEEVVMTIEKLMQVQVDRLDRKVASVVSGSKSELISRIDGDNDLFSNRFSEFDKRVKSVERSLKLGEWLSKDEFDRLVDDFKVKKAVGESTLDEIRAFAKGIVEDEIGKHAADGVGRVDYAVASGGG